MALKFSERLDRAHAAAADTPGLRGPRSGPRPPSPDDLRSDRAPLLALQPPHRRRDPRPVRRPISPRSPSHSCAREGSRARRQHPLYPRARSGGARHPRREARRHRQHRRGVRPRGFRALRCRRGHGQSLHGRGRRAAVFLRAPDRGAVLLCRTSNPGGHDFQDLVIDGLPLYRESRGCARRPPLEPARQSDAGGRRNARPQEMADIAARPPRAFFSRARNRRAGRRISRAPCRRDSTRAARAFLVSSSRAVIYAGGGTSSAIREERRRSSMGLINRRRVSVAAAPV